MDIPRRRGRGPAVGCRVDIPRAAGVVLSKIRGNFGAAALLRLDHHLHPEHKHHDAVDVDRQHHVVLGGKTHLVQRSHRFVDALVQRIFQTLPPRLSLEEAISRIDEIIINLPAVEQFQHRQREDVGDELERNANQREQQEIVPGRR